ncbi:MAG: hypothetical protein HUU37_08650 [Bdellovibrionales bacterium]|nr:hypothetical protein [Bdellovibrionales bacterium]
MRRSIAACLILGALIAQPAHALIFAESGATFAAHYNLVEYDSTPPAALSAVIRAGGGWPGLHAYAEAALPGVFAKAQWFAAGARLRFFTVAKINSVGAWADWIDYRTREASPPQTYAQRTRTIRGGGWLKSGQKTYALLSMGFARISGNLFMFPSLAVGVQF